MTRETEHELTLEQRRANESLADDAVAEIHNIARQCNIRVGKVLAELAEEVGTDIDAYDSDWIANLETFEDELSAAVTDQFETM